MQGINSNGSESNIGMNSSFGDMSQMQSMMKTVVLIVVVDVTIHSVFALASKCFELNRTNTEPKTDVVEKNRDFNSNTSLVKRIYTLIGSALVGAALATISTVALVAIGLSLYNAALVTSGLTLGVLLIAGVTSYCSANNEPNPRIL